MNKGLLILLLLPLAYKAYPQAYLRGEVKDEQNNPLSNAKILLHSTGYLYYSGNSGAFGIMIPGKTDSLTISLSGYQTVSLRVDASEYVVINLKLLHSTLAQQKNRLLSLTKNLELENRMNWAASGESYSSLVENEFVETVKYPETGFAIRIDKASYSNVRRFLNMDTRVPPDAVRIEELLNYFNFGYPSPLPGQDFGFRSQLSTCPWNPSSQLLFLQVAARKLDPGQIPPSNLVFLIDVSGSMDMPRKMPLLKSAFKLLVENLRENDTISIVVYGGAVGVFLPPTSGKEKERIHQAIEDLHPGGATPGESGILSAYRLAKSQYIPGGNNRVILATDGDFNVGQSSDEQLEQLITAHQETGIYLTCLGVGMGNYKDSKLEALAKKGNGNFSYIDSEEEAEKILVKEFTHTLYSVADDASLSIRFNADYVKRYRLLGYDNKLKALTDSITEIEGGEVGSGHSSMVLFEIEPVAGRPDISKDGGVLAGITINYRLPSDTLRYNTSFAVPRQFTPFEQLSPGLRFAGSVALFGSLLRDSEYTRKLSWNEAITLANASCDLQDPLQQEFIALMNKAKKIYQKKRKKRG